MAGEMQARKRKIKEKVKDAGGGDSADDEYEESPKDGSTCMSAVVLVLLLGGVGVLLTLISIQSGAMPYGEPPAPQRPLARSAEVVVERSEPADSSQPPLPQVDDASKEGTVLAASTESATADDQVQVAPPAEGAGGAPPVGDPVAHTAAPPGGQPGAPPPPPPPPQQQQGDFRLEGSEEVPADAEVPVLEKQEVRVRQMLRLHTHADGSITEEVVSEQILQPGDEGYDDLGKEPVTVAVNSEPVITTTQPMMTTTMDEHH